MPLLHKSRLLKGFLLLLLLLNIDHLSAVSSKNTEQTLPFNVKPLPLTQKTDYGNTEDEQQHILPELRWKFRRFVSTLRTRAQHTFERFSPVSNGNAASILEQKNATKPEWRPGLLRLRQRFAAKRRNGSSDGQNPGLQFYGALSDKFQYPELEPLKIMPTMQAIVGTASIETTTMREVVETTKMPIIIESTLMPATVVL